MRGIERGSRLLESGATEIGGSKRAWRRHLGANGGSPGKGGDLNELVKLGEMRVDLRRAAKPSRDRAAEAPHDILLRRGAGKAQAPARGAALAFSKGKVRQKHKHQVEVRNAGGRL